MKVKIAIILIVGLQMVAVTADNESSAENKPVAATVDETVIEVQPKPVLSWEEMSPQERKRYVMEARREELMTTQVKPDATEVICIKRTSRLGSRVKKTECKTRAEFRREAASAYDEIQTAMNRRGVRRALPNFEKMYRAKK